MSSGLYFKLDDLPERYRRQVEARQKGPVRAGSDIPAATEPGRPVTADDLMKRMGFPKAKEKRTGTAREASVVKGVPRSAAMESGTTERPYKPVSVRPVEPRNLREYRMTEPERKFNAEFLKGRGLYEAVTLRCPSGSRYTADWFFVDGDAPVLVECKGGHRLGSEGRARTAFMEAASFFSHIFRFVWAVYNKGKWEIKMVLPDDIEKKLENSKKGADKPPPDAV